MIKLDKVVDKIDIRRIFGEANKWVYEQWFSNPKFDEFLDEFNLNLIRTTHVSAISFL